MDLSDDYNKVHELLKKQSLASSAIVKATGFGKNKTVMILNELKGNAIAKFSEKLDRWQLYEYAKAVLDSSNQILYEHNYKDLKQKFGDDMKVKLRESKCINESCKRKRNPLSCTCDRRCSCPQSCGYLCRI